MAGNFSSLGLAGGAIKSIQRGASTAGTVTISSVNTAKTEMRNLGNANGGCTVTLTNSTTVTISGTGTTYWELTERY